jgi:DNA ligase 1
MSIQNVYEIMTGIANESSKTGKEAILKQHEGDMEFREALTFLLNPYIVTGISTKKMKKKVNPKEETIEAVNSLSEVMSYLKRSNSGRDYDIFVIQSFINSLETSELQEFVRKFVTKDLKLGISEKTVNKIYGKGTIPSFAVMLAESFSKKADKIKGKFYITLKLDGNRCVAIKENGKVKFFTRKGREIDGLLHLEEQFKVLPDNYVFDGELLLRNVNNLPSDELFRATQKVVRKDGEKENLEFYMFDILPLKEFKDGKSKLKYDQRRNILDTIVTPKVAEFQEITSLSGKQLTWVLPVMYGGTDKSIIPLIMKQVESDGYEGVMVNTANGLYQSKRVVDLLKVKTMKTADLLVMSIEKAIDGQFEGLLGRVNVEYKGNLVGVGSGFTLEQRRHFINNPDLIAGKIIEVQFFEQSTDEKTGQPSLRFPVFKGIRDDKSVEDINYGE